MAQDEGYIIDMFYDKGRALDLFSKYKDDVFTDVDEDGIFTMSCVWVEEVIINDDEEVVEGCDIIASAVQML